MEVDVKIGEAILFLQTLHSTCCKMTAQVDGSEVSILGLIAFEVGFSGIEGQIPFAG